MAPSPELGQPKAPDKTTLTSTTTDSNNVQSENNLKCNPNNDSSCNNDTKMNTFDDNSQASTKNVKLADSAAAATSATTTSTPAIFSSSSSSFTGAFSQNTSYASSPGSNSLNSTNLKNWDDCNFRSLLDEAYRYRSPKDRENKSETFLQLLQKAERKEEESEYLLRSLSSRYTQGTNRQKQGGSLQDLVKAAHNEVSIDVYGNRSHQHHHNSRPKKYSSVSSRQREGGSLPSNVNVSNCNLSICEQPFLNEEGNKRMGKNERTCSGTSCASGTSGTSSTVSTGQDLLISGGQVKDVAYTNSSGDTIIDMNESFADDTQHLLAHDSLAQGISEPLDCEEGTELPTLKKFPPRSVMSTSSSGKFECSLAEPKHYVDDSVTFPTLERGKSVEATYLHLNESYNACKSLLGGKAEIEKPPTAIFSNARTSTKHCDENGNSLNSPYNSSQSQQSKTKKKKPQSERNTTTLNVQFFPGYRGEDTVEELLKFIENTDTKKNDKNFNSNKRKEKKREREKEKEVNKKEIHKVKKSNSLEELRSCTKLDEDEKLDNPVTLRNKGKKANVTAPNSVVSDGKENFKQQNNKRGERRSWGTEELTYLGENNAIEEVREKAKEKEKKKSKETTEKQHEKSEKFELNKKKKEDSSLHSTLLLSETLHNESAEFHVVTKKKKPKKRQQADETRPGGGKNVSIKDSSSAVSHIHKKYHPSSNFTNDRDVYLSSFNTNEPRRKSTSSVPPSEKSDSSDLDSVHSLPVESTSNRHHNSGNLVSSSSAAAAVAAAARVVASATMTAAIATVMSSSNQIQPQSYADIARTVNANKFYNSITSPPIDKMDKWPSVSSYSATSSTSSNSATAGSISHTFGSPTDTQGTVSKNYKKSLNKDFPFLVSDKGITTNDAGSSCSSSSSTSTIVKQSSYSHSFSDDKCANFICGAKSPTASIGTKLTDVIKSSDGKQTLQKSKSVESDNYYSNMDHYPALEKTFKKHTLPNVTSNISQLPSLAATIKHQNHQRSATIVSNMSLATVENIGGCNNVDAISFAQNVSVPNSSSNVSCNLSSKKMKQPQPQQSNAKFTYPETPQTIITSSIVENNNAKNKQQVLLQQPLQHPPQQVTVTASASIMADQLNSNNNINVINNKKVKSEVVLFQQQQVSGANNPHGRKNKKEKLYQSSTNNCNITKNNSSSSSDPTMTTASISTSTINSSNSSSKISNRPAVIILNDTTDNSLSIGNDFTFGDFNEEELHLFDSNQHHQQFDDSGHFNLSQNVQDVITLAPVDCTPQQHDETIHLSPHSDHGYSSSNNRSILSESTDSSLCNRTEVSRATFQGVPPIIATDSGGTSNNDNADRCSSSCKNLQSQMILSTVETTPPAPNTATNLGTNFIVASAKVDLSCININSNSISELSYDPCIIAVNSVDINRNKSNIIYNSESSVQHQQKTQQLVNQILVNSSASSASSSSSSSSNISNNNNCNISNTSGMSSSNDNSPSLLLDSKINANSNDVTTTAVTTITLPVTDVTATSVSSVIDNLPAATTIPTSGDENVISSSSQKKLNIRFVAPPASRELNSFNFEKIVDFVGLAWEEISHGINRGTQFYNGQ